MVVYARVAGSRKLCRHVERRVDDGGLVESRRLPSRGECNRSRCCKRVSSRLPRFTSQWIDAGSTSNGMTRSPKRASRRDPRSACGECATALDADCGHAAAQAIADVLQNIRPAGTLTALVEQVRTDVGGRAAAVRREVLDRGQREHSCECRCLRDSRRGMRSAVLRAGASRALPILRSSRRSAASGSPTCLFPRHQSRACRCAIQPRSMERCSIWSPGPRCPASLCRRSCKCKSATTPCSRTIAG